MKNHPTPVCPSYYDNARGGRRVFNFRGATAGAHLSPLCRPPRPAGSTKREIFRRQGGRCGGRRGILQGQPPLTGVISGTGEGPEEESRAERTDWLGREEENNSPGRAERAGAAAGQAEAGG